MNINLYAKYPEDIHSFDDILNIIKSSADNIDISIESTRSFRILEDIKKEMTDNDIIIVSKIQSLGMNDVDIIKQLKWFIINSKILIIESFSSTFEYGITEPLNQAILNTLVISLEQNKNNTIKIIPKKAMGRTQIEFPADWEKLYKQWDKKEISSKQFLEKTGLKRATFYNFITEYRDIQNNISSLNNTKSS